MTSSDNIERIPIAASGTAATFAIELTETLRLAVPIALTQLGQIAMMTTDLALIGRLGDEVVAAAALAHTVFFISFTFGMGLMSAVAPLAAQGFGARNPRLVRRALRVGLWAGLLISLPMMVLPLYGERILLTLGQAPATAHLAQQFCEGSPGALRRRCGFWRSVASWARSTGRSRGCGSRLPRSRPMLCWSIS
jgi:MATE family multidrug resistance protein